MGKKNYGYGYVSGGKTNSINTPRTSSISISTKDVKAKVIKQNKKHQRFGFANIC